MNSSLSPQEIHMLAQSVWKDGSSLNNYRWHQERWRRSLLKEIENVYKHLDAGDGEAAQARIQQIRENLQPEHSSLRTGEVTYWLASLEQEAGTLAALSPSQGHLTAC